MMREGLRKIGVAKGEKRKLLQMPGKKEKPQAACGQRCGKIPHTGPGAGRKYRPGHPEEIDETHEDEPERDPRKKPGIALQVAREEQKERNEEVKNHDDHGDYAPFAIEPRAVEGDLFRLVARPDDEELGEVEISPEHHKGEQQLPQILNVALLKNTGEGSGARKQNDDGDHQRHGGNKLASDKQEPVNRGGPVR